MSHIRPLWEINLKTFKTYFLAKLFNLIQVNFLIIRFTHITPCHRNLVLLKTNIILQLMIDNKKLIINNHLNHNSYH